MSTALRGLLRERAREALRAFVAKHGPPSALGFVFTLYNVTPQLDLCAHVGELAEDEDERWNSGDYRFPAGLTGAHRELGEEFFAELTRLHDAARDEGPRGPIYRGLVELCSEVILDLLDAERLSPGIDLNVSEVGDPIDLVISRHALLTERRIPDSGRPYVPYSE